MDLKEENELLRAALTFYAEPKHWIKKVILADGTTCFVPEGEVYEDGGVRARRLLGWPLAPKLDPVELCEFYNRQGKPKADE